MLWKVAASGHDFCSYCLLLSPHTKLPVYSKLQDTLSRQREHIFHGNAWPAVLAALSASLWLINIAICGWPTSEGSLSRSRSLWAKCGAVRWRRFFRHPGTWLEHKVKVTQLMAKVSLNDQWKFQKSQWNCKLVRGQRGIDTNYQQGLIHSLLRSKDLKEEFKE